MFIWKYNRPRSFFSAFNKNFNLFTTIHSQQLIFLHTYICMTLLYPYIYIFKSLICSACHKKTKNLDCWLKQWKFYFLTDLKAGRERSRAGSAGFCCGLSCWLICRPPSLCTVSSVSTLLIRAQF